jgi:DNA-binding CsgD family transcriptional regulator
MYNKREKEVMELRKKGLSHKEIADKLGVTEKTSRQTMSNANRIKKFLENLKKD